MSWRTSGLVLLLSTALLAGGAGAAPIVGRVVSVRDGTPVAGATVATLDGARTATTDAEGRYRIEGSEALRTLLVTAPGYAGAPAPDPGFTVTHTGAGPYRQDFELRPARPLRGRVVDADGEAVAGVLVAFLLRDLISGADEGVVRSATDGGFRLSEPPPGASDRVFAADAGDRFGRSEPIARDADGAAAPVVVRLLDAFVVEGRVVGAEGGPVAGAQVRTTSEYGRLRFPSPFRAESTARTDADGRFRLRLPPWGRPGLAVIEKGVWPPVAWSAPFVATPGGRVEVRIEAGVRGPIEGVVVDGNGQPAAGVEVRAYPELWNGGRPAWLAATTDEAGRFSIPGALSEPHRLAAVRWASHDGHVFDLGSEPISGVLPGGPGHRLVLPTPGAVLVTVEDADGRPVPDVDVYLDSGHRYPFDAASQVDGIPAAAVKIEDGRIVVDDPIADVVPISSRRADDRLRLDRKGRHRIPEIRPGPVRFVVEDVRARPAEIEVRAESGRTVRARIRVVLRGRLDVAVTDGAGRPIAGAEVAVLDDAGEPVPVLVRPDVMSSVGGGYRFATVEERVLEQVRTDEDGRTATRSLDPGSYRLRVRKEGREPWEGPLRVTSGSRLRPEVALPAGK